MKQTKLLWLCLMVLLFSCSKEAEEAIPKPETSILIQEAENYFEAHYQPGEVATESSLNKYGAKFANVDWAMAKEKEISLGKAVVVPLIFENDVYVGLGKSNKRHSLSATTFLFMYKDTQQNMYTEVVRYVPNDAYVAEPQKPFLGLVVIEDISGNFKAGYYFDGSKAIPFTRSSQSEQVAVNSGTAVTSGWCETTTYYSCPGYDVPLADCSVVGVDEYCYSNDQYLLTRPYDYETGSMIGDGDLSGGSGGYSPPAETTADPCSQANTLAQEQKFVDKMSDLFGKTSLPYESAYLAKNNNGVITYDYMIGGQSGKDFNLSSSLFSGSTGFYHNHENNPLNHSIFSADDFRSFYIIVSQGGVYDQKEYTFGLVTHYGDSYLLVIENLSKFLKFGAAFLNEDSRIFFDPIYNGSISTSNTRAQNEAGFLSILNMGEGAGVKLFKGDLNSFDKFKLVSSDTNKNVSYSDCN